MTINKCKQKNNTYNVLAVKKVAEIYAVSERYVRSALKGDRVGLVPDRLIAEYKRLSSKIDQATDQVVNNFINF